MYSVYKTTNLVNGKIYVGVHYENEWKYFGSGHAIVRALKKYGKRNFSREILKAFETAEEAYDYERELVNEDFIADPNTYNMMIGGKGSLLGKYSPAYGRKHTPEQKLKQHASLKKVLNRPEIRHKMSEAGRGSNNHFYGKHHSDKTRQQISDSCKGNAPPNKGKSMNSEQKCKLSKTMKGRHSPWTQSRVEISGLHFESMKAASKHFGVVTQTIGNWLDSGKNGAKRLDPKRPH